MKLRIAIWAAAGFLVAIGWTAYFIERNKDLAIEPIVSTLIRVSCPISIFGSHHPVSQYAALAANVATYAVVGLAIEALRLSIQTLFLTFRFLSAD
jgi:hypothetical protein